MSTTKLSLIVASVIVAAAAAYVMSRELAEVALSFPGEPSANGNGQSERVAVPVTEAAE